MAVNSYNPRLGFSSISSENEEVLHNKFGMVGQTTSAMKNRSLSDPVYSNGKDFKKEDAKAIGRTPALSDSSNVLKRTTGLPSHSKMLIKDKAECSTICEEFSQSSFVEDSCLAAKSETELGFPEPERMRAERSRNTHGFILKKDQNGSSDLEEEIDIDEMENDPMLMRDVVFEAEDFHQTETEATTEEVDHIVEDDDDNYPEIEHFPSGYGSYIYDDISSVFSHDTGRYAPRSCDESFPELPDDILNTDSSYFTDYEYDLTPAEMESEIPVPANPLQMKVVFGEDW